MPEDNNIPGEGEDEGGKELTAEEMQEKVAKLEEELAKEREKEKNFAKFRKQVKKLEEMNEEEKGQFTEKEQALLRRMEELEGELTVYKSANREEAVSTVLEAVAGTDEAFQAKVMEEYNILSMPDATKSEIQARMAKAYRLAGGQTNRTSSMAGVRSMSGNPNTIDHSRGSVDFSKTEAGSDMLSRMGHVSKKKEE